MRLHAFPVRALCGLLVIAACLGCGAAHSAEPDAGATAVRCGARQVTVRSPDTAEALLACLGARDAVDFLSAQGLAVNDEIAIEEVSALPAVAAPTSAGAFLESERRVVILTYPRFEKFGTWFGLPIDRRLYRSLIAHEMAHAIAHSNFAIAEPSIQAKEYIAYVTQLATMPPELRKSVMSQFSDHGYQDEAKMSSTIYMFDPMRFGVQAYRHFLRPENGRAFLHAILEGKVLVE
jgi:hypothetical protein